MVTYPKPFMKIISLSTIEVSQSLDLEGLKIIESSVYQEFSKENLISMLVFMGPDLNGAFSISCSPEYLRYTNPVKQKDLDLDWQSEISNRVIGAVKAKSIEHQLEFEVSIPITTKPKSFSRASETIGSIQGFCLQKDSILISVYFCGVFSKLATFSGNPNSESVIGGLGDVILF